MLCFDLHAALDLVGVERKLKESLTYPCCSPMGLLNTLAPQVRVEEMGLFRDKMGIMIWVELFCLDPSLPSLTQPQFSHPSSFHPLSALFYSPPLPLVAHGYSALLLVLLSFLTEGRRCPCHQPLHVFRKPFPCHKRFHALTESWLRYNFASSFSDRLVNLPLMNFRNWSFQGLNLGFLAENKMP